MKIVYASRVPPRRNEASMIGGKLGFAETIEKHLLFHDFDNLEACLLKRKSSKKLIQNNVECIRSLLIAFG